MSHESKRATRTQWQQTTNISQPNEPTEQQVANITIASSLLVNGVVVPTNRMLAICTLLLMSMSCVIRYVRVLTNHQRQQQQQKQ